MEYKKLEDIIEFNPIEKLKKGTIAKKISMDNLGIFSKYINSFKIEKYNSGMKFKNGDTLLARITPCLENGKTSKVTVLDKNEVGFGSTEYIVMRSKKDISDEDFVFYLAISPQFREIAIKSMTGTSGRQRVQLNVIKNAKMLIPNYTVQRKIGKILSILDKKIKLNNQINDNLHDLAEQQFIKIYKTGEEKTLDDLLDNVSTGSRPKGGAQSEGIPSIGAEKIEKFGVYDYSSEKYISENFYENLKNGKINSGDVLLYKDGAYTGKVSMCLNGFPHDKSAVNEHVFILNTKNNWAQNYLYFTIYNKENKEMLEKIASSKAAQPGLNQTELKSLKINICNKEIIENFEINIKPIMENIANNSLENKKLSELRDTLLPKLMNGEIDLDKIEI